MKNANPAIDRSAPAFTIGRVSRFTPEEETANTISHIIGTILAVYATVLMLFYAIRSGDTTLVAGSAIFGASMISLYLFSTLNHALRTGRGKDIFHNLDQIAVYLLIAGTYTPFALVMRHDWGWFLLGAEWTLAAGGIVLKLLMPGTFERGVNILVIGSYVIMGWMIVFFLNPTLRIFPSECIFLILLGGVFYTIGIIFFRMKDLKYSHLIWHIMVMVGTAVHWWAVMRYVLLA
jgi:hemolysin III